MDLWAVTASRSYVPDSLCLVVCEASLGKAPPLWAACEEVCGTNMRGEIMMMGLEQGNHHNAWDVV